MPTIAEYQERLREVDRKIHALEKLECVRQPGTEHIWAIQVAYSEILALLDDIQIDFEDNHWRYFDRDLDGDEHSELPEEDQQYLELMEARKILGLVVGGMRFRLRSLDMHEDEYCIPGFRWHRRDDEWSDQALEPLYFPYMWPGLIEKARSLIEGGASE